VPGFVFDLLPMPPQLVSLLGVFVLLGLCYALSHARRAISWRLVGGGLLIEAVLGGLFLYWDHGRQRLYAFGEGVKAFLDLSQDGSRFVFNALASFPSVQQAFVASAAEWKGSQGFIFATQVLPTLIFFSALMAVLYHLGVMQLVVKGMAIVMARVLGTSGAESLSACGNVFVGQTEAPLLVRPFLSRMTQSELHAVMTGGFATIAGGVFALYVGFGIEPGHLIVASVMAVPAGLVCSKMLWPETEQSETMGRVEISKEKTAHNVVEAAANGAGDGLKLALNVAAMLIAFLGLMAVVNWLLGHVGGWIAAERWLLPEGKALSLDLLLGWLFSPIAAVMGVPAGEITTLGQLLGKKLVLTELIAYQELGTIKQTLSPRTVMIASFALCGFANFGSVAILLGGMGGIAPTRRADLAALGLRSIVAGTLATLMTGCVASLLL
jgi:CNT family concentrative nucleoside transporter